MDVTVREKLILKPGDPIGFLGDGQLAKMGGDAAWDAGYPAFIFGTSTNNSAFTDGKHRHTIGAVGAYDDPTMIKAFAEQGMKVASPEWENVPPILLEELERLGVRVYPGINAFKTASNRVMEKEFLSKHVEVTPWIKIDCENDLLIDLGPYTPGILKTQGSGYDGKGQKEVAVPEGTPYVWDSLRRAPSILEKRVNIDYEISVVLARGQDGRIVHFPITKNFHKEGILRRCVYQKDAIPHYIEIVAIKAAYSIAIELDFVGVFTVEFFVTKDGKLFGNEMAPRVHNSGHWTLDGCNVSQFDLWVRTLTGMPLVEPKALYDVVIMHNLLCAEDISEAKIEAYENEGGRIHLYGKKPREDELRKIGHVTYLHRKVK